MSHRWWNDLLGWTFAGVAAASAVVILHAAGLRDELAVGLPGVTIGVIGWVWWAVAKVNRKRDPALSLTSGEVDALRYRMEDFELLQTRLAELEERLEFSERMLARLNDERQLPGQR